MIIDHVCPNCKANVWRVFVSRNLAQCHGCGTEFKLSDLTNPIKIQHQR